MVDKTIFKAYDVRGTYPDQINKEVAYKIGRALVEFLEVKQVAVGYDMRNSAAELFNGLAQGINDAGAQVINLGLIGTEMMYFAVGSKNYEAGIMITASHNPAKYNGMKIVKAGAFPIGAETGMNEISKIVAEKDYQHLNAEPNIIEYDVYQDYKSRLMELVDFSKIKHFKLVVDAANGMGGKMFTYNLEDMGHEVIPLYFEPDGNFPNHEANPIKEENTRELRARVISENADLGIALDGDGDRVFFIDENGEYTSGYFLVALIAGEILKLKPGSIIVHENRLEWAIIDDVTQLGGIPFRSKPGHSYIKANMREQNGAFGGENSSHFYYADLSFADSSMLTIVLLLQLLTQSGKTLSELLKPYKEKYFTIPETNFIVENADIVIEKIKDEYLAKGYKFDDTDGIAFDNNREWHFSIRKSNTEPLLRLNIEGSSETIIQNLLIELTAKIGGKPEE